MATLWIREYRKIAKVPQSAAQSLWIPVALEAGTDQSPVTFTTATQSAAFGGTTRYVTIVGSAAFHYLVGSNPTATTNHLKIPADTPWSFGVTPGDKLSVIAAS